jgi:TonB-linked SusC/RagA family outer membrane protein
MKQKLLAFFMVGFLLIGSAIAQDRKISGTVTAEEDGLGLPGVTVQVSGTSIGTQTDVNGNYALSVPANSQSLDFSFIGFVKQTVAIGSSATINVTLSADATQLGEVVVTALGIERRKDELGYSAATLSNESLTTVNPVNVVSGLQGKVSGLNITGVGSSVFEEVNINLRGIRSLTGNNSPLLVLDGIPADIAYLSSLNPNDIQNVSVLKGSSAAAIYGPDARNGVIIVTTRKGSETPTITIGHSTQFQEVSFFPKLQTQFGQGGYGEHSPYENWSWGPAYDGSQQTLGRQLPDGSQQMVTYSPTNERQDFYNTGVTIQNDVSLSVKDFYLSLQDANIKGIVPDDRNRRTGVRLNAAREYGKFRAGINTNYSQQNYETFNDDAMSDYFTSQGTGGNGGLLNQIFNTPAHIPISKYKNFETDPFADYNGFFNDYGLNPYFAIDNWRKSGKRQDLLTNLDLSFQANEWLSFVYRAGLISRTVNDRSFSKGETPSAFGLSRSFTAIPGSINERSYSYTRLSSELFGSVDKQLNDDFKLNAILGTYLRQTDNRNTQVGASSLVVPELYNIENRTGSLSGSSPGYRSRLMSYYGSVGLSYRGWANIEVTGRNDQTSLLATGNNSYFYPGVSGSVILTEAVPMLQENSVLSYFKLRAAYNKTGNAEINPYSLAATFTQPNWTGFPFGSNPGFTAGNTTYNANLNPEFIKSLEFGFEASFFDNKVDLEATYYNQDNTDQIIGVRVSDATGYTRANLNAASFINKGVELDLGFAPLFSFPDGNFNFRANASYNDSEVTSIYPGLEDLSIGGYVASSNWAVLGKPAFVLRGTDYLRDDQGRVIVDINSGLPSQDPTLKDFGRTMPKWTVGLNPSVNWKSFNLSALFEYKGGHNASFFAMGGDMAWTGVSAATAYNNREKFVFPNSSYEDPANPGQYIENKTVTISDANDFYTGVFGDVASNFIVSAASWRLRELALSYDVPQSFLARQNVVKGLNISLTGRNLFLWVPSTNEFSDPDFNSMNDDYNNTFGIINSSSNPPVRNYGFTVTAKF